MSETIRMRKGPKISQHNAIRISSIEMAKGDDIPEDEDTPRLHIEKRQQKDSNKLDHLESSILKYSKFSKWNFIEVQNSTLCYTSQTADQVKTEFISQNRVKTEDQSGSGSYLLPVLALVNSACLIWSYTNVSSINLVLPVCLIWNVICIILKTCSMRSKKSKSQKGDLVMVKVTNCVEVEPKRVLDVICSDSDYNSTVLNVLEDGHQSNKFRTSFPKIVTEESKDESYALETSKFEGNEVVQVLYYIAEVPLDLNNSCSSVSYIPSSEVTLYCSHTNPRSLIKLLCSKVDCLKTKASLLPKQAMLMNIDPGRSTQASAQNDQTLKENSDFKNGVDSSQNEFMNEESEEQPVAIAKEVPLSEDERYDLMVSKAPEPEQKYLRMAKEGMDRFRKLISETEWREIDVRGDFRLFDVDSTGDVECMMSNGYLDYSVKDVAEYLRRDQVQKQFDDNFLDDRVVKQLSMDTKVVHSRFKAVWPVQGRDFCNLVKAHWFDDGSFTNITFSIEDDDCPPTKTHTRAEIINGGWLIKPVEGDPNRSFAISISHFDPKGNIPKSLVNYLTKSKGSYVKIVSDAMAKYF